MTDLNGWGVDTSRLSPGVRIRLVGADGGTSMGTVAGMCSPRSGRMAVYNPIGGHTGESALFHADSVCGAGLVCDVAGPLPAPSWALNYVDFPTGWHIQRQGVIHVDHQCSAVQAWGGFLCDCGAIEAEWKRRRAGLARHRQRKRNEARRSREQDRT